MNLQPAQIAIIISLFALVVTVINFWYNSLRKGKPVFTCSRWTAIGVEASGQQGSTFAINIAVINEGKYPLVLTDFLLVAETHNKKKIFFDPIILFDLTYYIGSMGEQARMAKAQKGQIPLPIIVPPSQQYTFEKEILFMPYDKATTIINNVDAPFSLSLYALTDRDSNYIKIAEQQFRPEDINTLVNGSFAGVLSSYSTKNREVFINKLK